MEDFEELYRLYSKQLFRYLLYLCRNYHTAEELLQETYYQAFISIHRFKGKSKLSTWLYQIAKHVYHKHRKKQSRISMSSNQNLSFLADATTPETVYEEKEEHLKLLEAIHQLKDPYKEVVVLHSFNELPFKEIGEIYSRSENWARVTFYRAKLQLRRILKEVGR